MINDINLNLSLGCEVEASTRISIIFTKKEKGDLRKWNY